MRDTVRGQVRDGVRDTVREPVHHCPGKERSDAHSSLNDLFSYSRKQFLHKNVVRKCAHVPRQFTQVRPYKNVFCLVLFLRICLSKVH